jgi:hypothetical protein
MGGLVVDLERIVERIGGLSEEGLEELAGFVEYLRWKHAPAGAPSEGRSWSYDFCEHLGRAAVTADLNPAGMDVQVGETTCSGEERMALWQHPPVQGSAIVDYQVPIPAGVRNLRLRFATGIRDGAELAEGNIVAFRVFFNDWKIWSDTQRASRWKERDFEVPTLPGDVVRLRFMTDGLGNHEWAWAAWGEPRLVGEIG